MKPTLHFAAQRAYLGILFSYNPRKMLPLGSSSKVHCCALGCPKETPGGSVGDFSFWGQHWHLLDKVCNYNYYVVRNSLNKCKFEAILRQTTGRHQGQRLLLLVTVLQIQLNISQAGTIGKRTRDWWSHFKEGFCSVIDKPFWATAKEMYEVFLANNFVD